MRAEPRRLRVWIASLLACLVLATGARAENNCAGGGRPRPDQGGVGGTGARPAEGGIGGTGVRPQGADGIGGTGAHPDGIGGTGAHPDGIGGTGISAQDDIGIIGTVTGFASVCVGGVEIHYSPETPVEIDGQAASAMQLAVGQVVEVVASGSGDEVNARSIALRHLVSGPITRVDGERNTIDVVGQTVQITPSTRSDLDEQSLGATSFSPGSTVKVSGLRRGDGIIVASRVTADPGAEVVRLDGPVTALNDRGITIAGVNINAGPPPLLELGETVRVTGRWDGNAITASSMESIPVVPFDGRVSRVNLEGYARGPMQAGQMYVGPFRVEMAAEDLEQARPAGHLRLHAVIRDRHVIAERVAPVGDLPPLPPGRGPGFNNQGGPDEHGAGFNNQGGPDDHNQFEDRPNHGPADPEHGQHPGPPPPPRPDAAPDLPHSFPPDFDHGDRPGRPERPPMPSAPDFPERPNLPDRPPRPERPNSDRPPRIDRPGMDRPPRPEMPDMHRR